MQGTLDMLILKTLALEPMHGYGIGVRIEQISKGVFQVNAGSLFPALPPPGARRADQGRVARDREQPPREVLRAHRAGARQAQTRDARLGSPDDRDRAEFSAPRREARDGAGSSVCVGGLRGAAAQRTQVEQDLDAELRDYLETAIERRNADAGMTREDAGRDGARSRWAASKQSRTRCATSAGNRSVDSVLAGRALRRAIAAPVAGLRRASPSSRSRSASAPTRPSSPS